MNDVRRRPPGNADALKAIKQTFVGLFHIAPDYDWAGDALGMRRQANLAFKALDRLVEQAAGGAGLIAERRLEHIDDGYDAAHDDQHDCGEIPVAAECYLDAHADSSIAERGAHERFKRHRVEVRVDEETYHRHTCTSRQVGRFGSDGKLEWTVVYPKPEWKECAGQ